MRCKATTTIATAAALTIGAVWMSGCAIAEQREAAGEPPEIEVRNDIQPPTPVTVFVIDPSGSRTHLGNVSPQQTVTFPFRQYRPGESYRLVARTTAGDVLASTDIVLSGGETVSWNLTDTIVSP